MSRITVTGLRMLLRAKRIADEARSKRKYGQANKGPWWMPRSYCTRKAVVSCEIHQGEPDERDIPQGFTRLGSTFGAVDETSLPRRMWA